MGLSRSTFRLAGLDTSMGLWNPLGALLLCGVLVGVLALAVLAVRRLAGTDDAVIVTSIAGLIVISITVAAWRADGATTVTAALAAVSAASLMSVGVSVHRRMQAPRREP